MQTRRTFLMSAGAVTVSGGVAPLISDAETMPSQMNQASRADPKGPAVTAATQFVQTPSEKYAYRRFGKKSGVPLLLLQHFTGTLDNWDPALTTALSVEHDVILFDDAGIGLSTGKVPTTMSGMAEHTLSFLDSMKIPTCDVLGYSLGGMVGQQMVLDRPSIFRKIILAATAPRGGEDVMSYVAGVIGLTDVLDADRQLLVAKDEFAVSRATADRAAVGSFRALGGG